MIKATDKVEKILKGSLNSIPSPSPSMKIQIMGRKVCFMCKGKTLLGIVNKLLKNKKFVNITQQYFALLPHLNFPANNLNFHWRWRWWDRIQAIFINIFYFTFASVIFLYSYKCISKFSDIDGVIKAFNPSVQLQRARLFSATKDTEDWDTTLEEWQHSRESSLPNCCR